MALFLVVALHRYSCNHSCRFFSHHNHTYIRTPASVAMIYKRESSPNIRQRGDLA
jgi:hypothetical protein